MTSIGIKDLILANLDMNNQDNAALTLFRVYENMTLAQRQITMEFPLREIDNAVKTITFNVANGVSQYQFQDDHLKLLALWIDYAAAITASNPGVEVTEGPATGHYPMSADARPSKLFPKWKPVKNGFDIRPAPTVAVTNGFRMQYIQKLDTLDSTTDPTLRDHLEEALVCLATSFCCAIDDYNLALGTHFRQRYEAIKQSYFNRGV